jgi:uroporphyrinogen-III decarboxylase
LDADFGLWARSDPSIETTVEMERRGSQAFITTTVHTHGRNLRCVQRMDDSVHTKWIIEPLVKSVEDVRAFLNLPVGPAVVDRASFHRVQNALGNRGLMMPHIADPVGYAAELLGYQEFLMWAFTEREWVEQILRAVWTRLRARLRAELAEGMGPVYRIIGAEYVLPPALPPSYFEDWIVTYDQQIIDLLHEHGYFARFHCHGRLASVLGMICAMQPDILEPCEPPPWGDTTLGELANVVRDSVVLMGNVEVSDLETAETKVIDELVRQAIESCRGRARLILATSSGLYSAPLPPRTEANLAQFFDSALKYGAE